MKKPLVILTGTDGNAFAIMGKVRAALKKAGATPEYIKQYSDEATSGDYDHLLQVSMKYAHVE
jgi:hypothetical protein